METQSVIDFSPREDKRNIEHFRRENSFWKEVSLIDLDTGTSAAEARFYGSGQTVYCVIWIHGWHYHTESARGYGKAGGYGYHKPSAALSAALKAAGVTLEESIAGRGDEVMKEAMRALAADLGIARPYVHEAHA